MQKRFMLAFLEFVECNRLPCTCISKCGLFVARRTITPGLRYSLRRVLKSLRLGGDSCQHGEGFRGFCKHQHTINIECITIDSCAGSEQCQKRHGRGHILGNVRTRFEQCRRLWAYLQTRSFEARGSTEGSCGNIAPK